MDVGVRNLKAGDEVASTWSVKSGDNSLTNLLGNLIEMSPQLRRGVCPLVHLFNRDNQSVTRWFWLDGKKCDDLLMAFEKTTGEFTVDNLGKYCAHVPRVTRIAD